MAAMMAVIYLPPLLLVEPVDLLEVEAFLVVEDLVPVFFLEAVFLAGEAGSDMTGRRRGKERQTEKRVDERKK